MAYRIEGLPRRLFEALLGQPDDVLERSGAIRVRADNASGFPCRISLDDARPGESLILLNFVSHDVPTPFRTAYAIYVRDDAAEPAPFEDWVPPYLDRRTLGLRGFDGAGMLKAGLLAAPGEADARIRDLFARPEIATIHAHNAAAGCFLARIERDG